MPHWLVLILLLPLAAVGIALWTTHTVNWWVYRTYRAPEEQRVRLATIVLQLLVFVAPISVALPGLFTFESRKLATQVVGLVLYHLGIGLAIWGKRVMGAAWGPPATRPDARDREVRLVTTGPFRYSRNPLYFGLWVGLLGGYLALESWLVLAVLATSLLFPRLLDAEERLMEETFGDRYQAYARRTSRWWPLPPRQSRPELGNVAG